MNLRRLKLQNIQNFNIYSGHFRNAHNIEHYKQYYNNININDIYNNQGNYEKYPIFRAKYYSSFKTKPSNKESIYIIIYLIDEKKYATISENRYLDALKNV